MAARVPRGPQARWLGIALFTFGSCLLGLIGLISRFGNYRLEGLIVLPLDEPGWAWGLLDHLSLYQFMRFRLWSMIGFAVSVVGFSFSYGVERWRRGDWLAAGLMSLLAIALCWYYDPEHLFTLYQAGTSLLDNPPARAGWERNLRALDFLSLGSIVLSLLYALGRILWLWGRATIPQKRAQALCVGIGNGTLTAFFIFLFCLGPAKVLDAHAMATTLLPAAGYPVFDTTLLLAVPFAGLAAMGAVMLSIWRFGFLGTWHVGTRDLDRQITVANQAVRLALHSFKNRFLAVQMAMDMAGAQLEGFAETGAAKARTQIQWARDVCREALAQLDTLHVQAGRLQVNPNAWSWQELWAEALHRCAQDQEMIITTSSPVGQVRIWGDREHLVAVLENLLQNSCDALAESCLKNQDGRIQVEIGREYEWGYVRISDNGPGIPRKHLRKVFRPFFTTKPTKSNWGMGLAYCHRVLKAHGGFINLRTRPGQGTTVEVVLRCRDNLDTTPAISPAPAPGAEKTSA